MRNYRINNFEDDGLNPEESLFDSVSGDAAIEKPIKSGFFIFFYFAIAAVFITFLAAGFKINVLGGEYFAQLSERNRFISVPISAPRGLIYSQDGEILAGNKTSDSLWLIPSKLVNIQETTKKISGILGIEEESIKTSIERNSGRASFLLEEINEEEKEKITAFKEPGVEVVDNFTRTYQGSEAFAHLLGYVSAVSENDLTRDDFYKPNDKIGRTGIEREYEAALRGKTGETLIPRFGEGSGGSSPEEGKSVILNIDSSLQKILYSELWRGLSESGSGFGVAVASDPRNGRILSLVSLPSFDPNSLVRGLNHEEYRLLFQNRAEPFLNRVISGRFAPGSTIKPLLALAALREEVITPEKKIDAPGFISIVNPYNPDIVYTFRDWRNHGRVNMREAIAHSSDIYFYTVGGGYYDVKGLGIQKIAEYMKLFKLDSILGIDLPGEVSGFVPTPEWKRDYRNEIWYQGDTFNVSIGQGDVLVTPLWLNAYIGAVGHGKAMYKPFAAAKILDREGNIVEAFEPEVLFELPFSDEEIKIVKEGMKLAATQGTARILGDLPYDVGAKSGTAEVIKGQSTNSWISVFAPYDNPQLALTIIMESGREGSYIPHQIAYRILKNYFEN